MNGKRGPELFRLIGFISGVMVAMIVLTNLFDTPSVDAIREVADQLWPRDATKAHETKPGQETSMANSERENTASARQHAGGRDNGLLSSARTPIKTEITTTESVQEPQEASGSKTKPNDSVTLWHAVWNPFRSELSASGFADRLTRLTDGEYRVRRVSVGAYQVEVSYDPDTGVGDTLMQIQMMTGLRIGESQP